MREEGEQPKLTAAFYKKQGIGMGEEEGEGNKRGQKEGGEKKGKEGGTGMEKGI